MAPTGEAALVRYLRMPRVLLAFLVGGALSVAGASLQALVRNPLADPYLVGLSGGAGLGAVLAGGVTTVAFTAILRVRAVVEAAGAGVVANRTLLVIGLLALASIAAAQEVNVWATNQLEADYSTELDESTMLSAVMEGALADVIGPLQQEWQAEQLAQLE